MKTTQLILFLFMFPMLSNAEDTLIFKGQISAYTHYNPTNDLQLWTGARYIPQLNYNISVPKKRLIDFEASANIYGNVGLEPGQFEADGNIKPYRAWARYSGEQFEVRLGLQKINFGSAMMLRPLMWFDQLDPRDPLQLTDGVWGLLGRYYFLNNANLWIWSLWCNKDPKMWETAKTIQKYPELGGRFQSPLAGGESAFTYHFRIADTRGFAMPSIADEEVAENRFGIDGKWDLGVGLWFEAVWITKSRNIGILTNQQIFNAGVDYTFGIGNGLNVVFEQLAFSSGLKPFSFSANYWFSGLAATYPPSIFDNLHAIIYFDWMTKSFYNFINWGKQFNKFDFNLMAYWNPENYNMPAQNTDRMLYGGKGLQLMVVYNH
jgi:hypothetical protein